MQVHQLERDASLEPVARILIQLRPQFTESGLIEQLRRQIDTMGYRIAAACDDDGNVLCVAGFVIQEKLAWGKSLYVDDLVTDARGRSIGAGTCMMSWLKAHARSLGCRQLHLDSGVQRFDAHRFYLREGFRIASHHFSIDLDHDH
ncbi:GNAT family N-acetyltransferase [Nitrogeniibacter aestuarii]|uniref:GNAT family N-acetyltransferase n=1 Tax=Nitrogeniibacter aestuarii TaxID=2815343 RepID=UPI001E64727E|nr:GNAT family N-acetyltransferase [Nitrogeniibacter aestuarii]